MRKKFLSDFKAVLVILWEEKRAPECGCHVILMVFNARMASRESQEGGGEKGKFVIIDFGIG